MYRTLRIYAYLCIYFYTALLVLYTYTMFEHLVCVFALVSHEAKDGPGRAQGRCVAVWCVPRAGRR